MHAWHVCSQNSFGLPRKMNGINVQNAIWSPAFGPSVTRNLIMCVLTISHVKLMQSTVLAQKCFEIRSLSPIFHNLWLLLMINYPISMWYLKSNL